MTQPHVELLFWDGCPSPRHGLSELRAAMTELGLDAEAVVVREVDTDYAAEREGFVGSPPIRVDRDDIHVGDAVLPLEDPVRSTARGFWDDGERRMNANARVGMLGVGLMGSAMAHRLLDRGIAVIEWDRDAEALRALEARGGESAEGPEAVVSGAGVVITMLPTAAIVLDVVEPTLGDWPQDTVWLQMSSVGAAEADQLSRVAETHGVRLVDAPVSGSTHPAEEGELTILASGPGSVRGAVEPVLDALGSRVLWVGEAGMGSRLKMAANHWMIAMVAVLAESMHLCQAMDLDEQQFIALLQDGPL